MNETYVPEKDGKEMQEADVWSGWGDHLVNEAEEKMELRLRMEREEVRRECGKEKPDVSEQNTENRD